jgi:hypothetical protein
MATFDLAFDELSVALSYALMASAGALPPPPPAKGKAPAPAPAST